MLPRSVKFTFAFAFFLFAGCFKPITLDERKLMEWRRTVGPAVVYTPPSKTGSTWPARLVVVSWNVNVGNGSILSLIERLSKETSNTGAAPPGVVMLLQESFRQGDEIPSLQGKTTAPNRIVHPSAVPDIEDIARELGWWLYYEPSMRNGEQKGGDAEDRGNAILSSFPLQDVRSVELPFSVQRRVALIAAVADTIGNPRLRVAVAHLDTRAPLIKGWILGGPFARTRQTEALADVLRRFDRDQLPMVLGGDLNTHTGPSEGAVNTLSALMTRSNCGPEPTHRSGFTLDYIFIRPVDPRPVRCVRLDDTFGSDHYPLVLFFDVDSTHVIGGLSPRLDFGKPAKGGDASGPLQSLNATPRWREPFY